MIITQSFWTKPMIMNNHLKDNLFIFGLSLTYLKLLDLEVILYTDKLGLSYLKDFPYDEIKLLPEQNIHSNFFTYTKIIEESFSQLGSIHIDGDVFIYDKIIIEKLQNQQSDVIVQTLINDINLWQLEHLKLINNLLQDKINICFQTPNCGIVKFNNLKLKNEYIQLYQKIMNILSSKNYFDPAINFIVEEYLLGSLITDQYTISSILPDNLISGNATVQYGMKHLVGNQKYKQITEIQKTLKELNLPLYKLITNDNTTT